MTYGHALDSLRRYMVKENLMTGITDVCMEEFRHKHMNLFKPMPTKQALVEAELKALHDREAEMAAQGELEYETSSDESWRHLTSFAIPSHGKMNMYEYRNETLFKMGSLSRIMSYHSVWDASQGSAMEFCFEDDD